jgi:hypothetical protein
MKRDKFAAGENTTRWDDEASGLMLYPYKEPIVKEKTIWRSINPKLYQGMLMIKQKLAGRWVDNPESEKFDAWQVAWRSNDGGEQVDMVFMTSDILESFEPIFEIVK